jgi:hypothetical protein
MNVQPESTAKRSQLPPLVVFEDQLAELCREDKYKEMADGYASFVKTHPGTSYLAFEPIPAKISDHLIAKTQSPSAFVTLTLRKPTWVNEIRKALDAPSAFQAYVASLEAEVQELARQAKKLN